MDSMHDEGAGGRQGEGGGGGDEGAGGGRKDGKRMHEDVLDVMDCSNGEISDESEQNEKEKQNKLNKTKDESKGRYKMRDLEHQEKAKEKDGKHNKWFKKISRKGHDYDASRSPDVGSDGWVCAWRFYVSNKERLSGRDSCTSIDGRQCDGRWRKARVVRNNT